MIRSGIVLLSFFTLTLNACSEEVTSPIVTPNSTKAQKNMKRRFAKNLSPKARKLILSGNHEQTVEIRLEYRSEFERQSLEEMLRKLEGVKIRSVQSETRNMSLSASVGVLESITQMPGIVYLEAQSQFRE